MPIDEAPEPIAIPVINNDHVLMLMKMLGLNPNHTGDFTLTCEFPVHGVASVKVTAHMWLTEKQIDYLRDAIVEDNPLFNVAVWLQNLDNLQDSTDGLTVTWDAKPKP